MPVDIHRTDGQYLEVTLSGKLAKEDYAKFVPVVEAAIKEHGKVRMLVVMHDFHGWTAGALWEDIKFDMHHFRDIGRLALVGESEMGSRHGNFLQAVHLGHD